MGAITSGSGCLLCAVCEEWVTDWRRYQGHYPRNESGGVDWDKVTGIHLCNRCASDALEVLLSGLTPEQQAEVWAEARKQQRR